MQFAVFSTRDPNVKVLAVISASSLQEAREKARAIHPDYSTVAIPPKAGVQAQESGRVYDVALREAGPTLGLAQGLVINAVMADVQAVHGIEVFMDGEVRYGVGNDLFSRTWSLSDGGQVNVSYG